jgi:hypothetical protein
MLMIKKYFEFMENSDRFGPMNSFYIHKNLNSDIWNEEILDDNIRQELLEIEIEIYDIILTGSLCGFNYSKYSDMDVHIIVKTDGTNLLKRYLDYSKKLWNIQHNINIKSFDVEVYCQDYDEYESEKDMDSPQYSLLKNEWIKKPSKEYRKIDHDAIKEKSELIMDMIDDIESQYSMDASYFDLEPKIRNVWKKISDNRRAGLEKEGEFSIENLVFKLLRRNGYIKKLLDLKIRIYDEQFK